MSDIANELLHMAMAVDVADVHYMKGMRGRIAALLREAAGDLNKQRAMISKLCDGWKFADLSETDYVAAKEIVGKYEEFRILDILGGPSAD
jgi:hypothetical protein